MTDSQLQIRPRHHQNRHSQRLVTGKTEEFRSQIFPLRASNKNNKKGMTWSLLSLIMSFFTACVNQQQVGHVHFKELVSAAPTWLKSVSLNMNILNLLVDLSN